MNYEIILLVIASRGNIYDKLIKNYWIPFIKYSQKYKEINIFLVFGSENKDGICNEIKDNELVFENTDTFIPGILIKTIRAFKLINDKYSYNKILRTNLSSFFIIDKMLKFSYSLPNTSLYAGFIGCYQNKKFCSGAGFLVFKKDTIEYILKNKDNINYDKPDDVSIGLLFKDSSLKPCPRVDIINNVNISNKKKLLQNIISKDMYHIRIKNSKDRNLDILYIREFTDYLYK